MSGLITLNSPDNKNRPLNTGDGTEFGDNPKTLIDNIKTMFTELFTGASSITGAKTFATAPTKFEAGTAASTTFNAGGNLSVNVTQLGSSATNTTQTLMSYVLPANALDSASRGLSITAWGTTAANAAPKTLALNVGGLTVNTGSQVFSGSAWLMSAIVYKTGANGQTGNLNATFGNTITKTVSSTDTSVDTGTINISVTMLDASAAQSNVLQNGLVVEYFQ